MIGRLLLYRLFVNKKSAYFDDDYRRLGRIATDLDRFRYATTGGITETSTRSDG